MRSAIRRSLKVGLLVAGLIYLGSGIASAQATPVGSTGRVVAQQQVVPHQPVALPQYRVKRGPLGTLVEGVMRRLQELTPQHGVQPMGLADRP